MAFLDGCVLTEEELQKFHYKIRFFNDEEEIQYKGPVITIDKPPADILKQQVGLVMTDAAIRRLIKNETLRFDFELFQIWPKIQVDPISRIVFKTYELSCVEVLKKSHLNIFFL